MECDKKSICEFCKGIGLIKNKNMYCEKCNSSRCVYTQNMPKDEFFKYKFCELCVVTDQCNSSPKTKLSNSLNSLNCLKCLKCLGEGYYLNSGVVCNACEIPHQVCDCVIKPFEECEMCCGSGTQIN